MKQIPLTQGKVALVDDEDFDFLNQWSWHIQKSGNTFYAIRTEWVTPEKCKCIRMHRVILGLKNPKKLVDHKDHDGLNNQRNNLRVGNSQQNGSNSRPRKNSSSKYLGVHFCNTRQRWVSQISIANKGKCLGVFSDEKLAALAYNEAAIKFHGEFANLNLV